MLPSSNRWTIYLLTLIGVAACGGGGGGGGGTGGTSYTIGGSVSGLTGAGLVLQNNGGNNLAIFNDGAFTFSTAIADGGAYNVTVATQPTGQSCAVSNGAGTVSGADVSNVDVACSDTSGGWGTAGVIESDDTGHTDEPHVDIDASGNAIAVWLQDDGISDKLMANRYVQGSGWGTAEVISDISDTDDAFIPNVAMDDAGNAIAVWRQGDSSTSFDLWANRYQMGAGWGTPELLETNDVHNVDDPRVAFNRTTGAAIVVWLQGQTGETGRYIWANHYAPLTSSWGGPVRIEGLAAANADNPQVAVNDSGNAVAVWENIDGDIRANIFIFGSGWQGPVDMGGATINGSNPQVGIGPSGNAVAVWEDAEGAGMVSIRAALYTAGTGWSASQTIESEVTSLAYAPQVRMDSSGNAIAAWYQSINTGFYRVYANRLPAGGAWGTPQLISDDTIDDDVHEPSLAVDDAGNAFVVYHNAVSVDDNIYAVRYQAGLGWLSPETIDATVGQARNLPVVAVNGSGEAVAVWNQRSNSTPPFDTWANLFE